MPTQDMTETPEMPTLAELLDAFAALPDQTESRKSRTRAAVATFARLLDRPATELPGNAGFVKRQFRALKNGPTGLSAKSLANCKSELLYLIPKTGVGRPQQIALLPEWTELRQSLGKQPLLWQLARFIKFCSAQGVRPMVVDEAVMSAFRTMLVDADEVDNANTVVRATIRAWNKLATIATSDSVELRRLDLPNGQWRRWTIEPARFPQSFQDEVAAWLDRLGHVDPEAEEGPIRPLRPVTLAHRRHQVFKAATALVLAGRAIEAVTLRALVEMDAFKTIMRYLRERQGGEPTEALYGLATTLKSIARHEVRVPEDHVKRMGRICANYKVEGKISKNQVRVQAFEDDRHLGALLHLPESLLREAARPKTSAKTARVLAQVAIALEVEAHAPIRRKNLAALNLRQNIQQIVIKGEPRWVIRFDREETKNRAKLTYELPAESVRRIERGLKYYEQTNGWLFPGRSGKHKWEQILSKQVKDAVQKRIGTAFNLHVMRGVTAVTQVRENESGFEMARVMLGDRDDKVIREHYTSTADRHLIAKAQDTIRRVRMRTAPIVTPRPARKAAR